MLAVVYAKHYIVCDANNRSVSYPGNNSAETSDLQSDWKTQFVTVYNSQKTQFVAVLYLRLDKSVRHGRGNLQQHSEHIIVALLAHCHGGVSEEHLVSYGISVRAAEAC